jgi:hypothetical protein
MRVVVWRRPLPIHFGKGENTFAGLDRQSIHVRKSKDRGAGGGQGAGECGARRLPARPATSAQPCTRVGVVNDSGIYLRKSLSLSDLAIGLIFVVFQCTQFAVNDLGFRGFGVVSVRSCRGSNLDTARCQAVAGFRVEATRGQAFKFDLASQLVASARHCFVYDS